MPETTDSEFIDVGYFKRMRLLVAKILSAENVEGSMKLLKLTISTGEKTKIILAGIKKDYSPESLVGKKIILIDNMKPAKLMGHESQGMLLAATDKDGNLALLCPDKDVAEGSTIS